MTLTSKFSLAFGAAILAAAGFACRTEPPGPAAVAGVVDGTTVIVRTATGGRLVEWTAVAGRTVAKDEVLGRIDPGRIENGLEELALAEREVRLAEDRARAQLPALQARVDFLREQAGRLERLRAERAVAGGETEKAKVDLLAAEAALADVQKALSGQAVQWEKIGNRRRALELAREDLVLQAPAAGILTAVLVTAGETLLPGAPAAEILNAASLFVEAFVEEPELGRLSLNGRATIRIDGREGETWTGRISEIGSKAEFAPAFTITEKKRRSLLYKVKVSLPTEAGPFKLGMPVTVVFDR